MTPPSGAASASTKYSASSTEATWVAAGQWRIVPSADSASSSRPSHNKIVSSGRVVRQLPPTHRPAAAHGSAGRLGAPQDALNGPHARKPCDAAPASVKILDASAATAPAGSNVSTTSATPSAARPTCAAT